MKNHYVAAIAMLLAIVSSSCSAKKSQNPMERIDALIAAGDTVTESGYHTPFVIMGAKVTPEMYEAEKLLVTPEKASSSDAPDSYLGIVMHHNGDVVACQKKFINLLFPNAQKFIVDGQEVTRAEFDRIPASLLRTVTGKDNGKKLVVETCSDVDDPNPAYTSTIDAENEWYVKNHQ